MKHLPLMAAILAVALTPTLAHADYKKGRDGHAQTYNRVNMNDRSATNQRGADYVVEVDNTESVTTTRSSSKTYSFATASGERIQIKGEAIYLVNANGQKFFAPNGAYTNPNGVTYIAENGLVLRAEAPDQTAYVYTNDGLDVDVKDKR